MNRPKKKKNQDPLLGEENVVDERNLIDTEESVEISFEDRAAIYWMENKGFIIGCFLLLCAVLVGINGLRMYKDSADAKLQAAFNEAKATETLADFAKANSDKSLGGFAALTVADEAYSAGEFDTAIEFYGIAASALDGYSLADRAQLGQAFALFNADQADQALAALSSLASDSSASEAVRAEAAYHLAVDAYTKGEKAVFDSYAEQVAGMPLGSQWQQRLDFYIRQGL